jgi:hypothetical protein
MFGKGEISYRFGPSGSKLVEGGVWCNESLILPGSGGPPFAWTKGRIREEREE